METLIIYDESGYILQTISGNAREPVGVPFIWFEVPEGKYVVSIDPVDHIPVLADLPVSQEQKILNLEQSVLELSMLVAGGAS